MTCPAQPAGSKHPDTWAASAAAGTEGRVELARGHSDPPIMSAPSVQGPASPVTSTGTVVVAAKATAMSASGTPRSMTGASTNGQGRASPGASPRRPLHQQPCESRSPADHACHVPAHLNSAAHLVVRAKRAGRRYYKATPMSLVEWPFCGCHAPSSFLASCLDSSSWQSSQPVHLTEACISASYPAGQAAAAQQAVAVVLAARAGNLWSLPLLQQTSGSPVPGVVTTTATPTGLISSPQPSVHKDTSSSRKVPEISDEPSGSLITPFRCVRVGAGWACQAGLISRIYHPSVIATLVSVLYLIHVRRQLHPVPPCPFFQVAETPGGCSD